MNNELETRGYHTSTEEPGVGRYIAIGLLLAFVFDFIALAYILASGKTRLFDLVIVFNQNYPAGALPNSGGGGGWTSGPLLILFLVLGIAGGWGYYHLKMTLRSMMKKKKSRKN